MAISSSMYVSIHSSFHLWVIYYVILLSIVYYLADECAMTPYWEHLQCMMLLHCVSFLQHFPCSPKIAINNFLRVSYIYLQKYVIFLELSFSCCYGSFHYCHYVDVTAAVFLIVSSSQAQTNVATIFWDINRKRSSLWYLQLYIIHSAA